MLNVPGRSRRDGPVYCVQDRAAAWLFAHRRSQARAGKGRTARPGGRACDLWDNGRSQSARGVLGLDEQCTGVTDRGTG